LPPLELANTTWIGVTTGAKPIFSRIFKPFNHVFQVDYETGHR